MSSRLTFEDLRDANDLRQREWDVNGITDTLEYRAMELGGEVGEALNVCKKLLRERLGLKGSRSSKEALADELADVVICADLIARVENIDLGIAVTRKFNKTSDNVGMSTKLPE